MTVLSDIALRDLYPAFHGATGPASIDLHLGDALLYWPDYIIRDPRTDQSDRWKTVSVYGTEEDDRVWMLKPGYRYLAATAERLAIPSDHAGQVAARSSWGRDGLAVICGPAGYLDPGFVGHITLELSVIGSDLVIWPGAAVAQLVMHRLDQPCERAYEGRYQDQEGPTPSRLHRGVMS